MDHGSTAYTGPPEGILHTEKIMKSLAGNPAEGKKPETNKNKDSEEVEGENTDEGLVKEEEKEVGVVKLHVYKSYWLAIGHCLATSILLSLFLMQGNVTIFNGGKNNFQWSVERIWECIVYILLCPVISLENSHHFLNQSDAELKPLMTWSPAFSRAFGAFFTLSSHWFLEVFSFLRIGHCNYFGFGFTTIDRNAFYLYSDFVFEGNWNSLENWSALIFFFGKFGLPAL